MTRFDFLEFFLDFFTSNGVYKWIGYKILFFRIFFLNFLDPKQSKNDQIYVQTSEFVVKRSNLNSNGPISRRHLTTTHQL
jgi:hypothetical protein